MNIEVLIVLGMFALFLAFREWVAERERRQHSKELSSLINRVLGFQSIDYMRWRTSETAIEAEAKRPRPEESPDDGPTHIEGVAV